MNNLDITSNNVCNKKDFYFISINDLEGEMSTSYFEKDSPNVLKLYFDDTVDDNKSMTVDQGKQIIEFLKKINPTDRTNLIIHCTAGQNRSGSVGKFAADFFNYGYNKFVSENPFIKGNSTVTRILNRLHLWNHFE